MHFLSDKAMWKYNLEKEQLETGEFFIKIEDSEWWVLGIDEKKNILYVQNDGDGIFHNISSCDIESLEMNDYVLVGVQKTFILGMISTRDMVNPIQDVHDWINSDMVYKVQYIGPDINLEE